MAGGGVMISNICPGCMMGVLARILKDIKIPAGKKRCMFVPSTDCFDGWHREYFGAEHVVDDSADFASALKGAQLGSKGKHVIFGVAKGFDSCGGIEVIDVKLFGVRSVMQAKAKIQTAVDAEKLFVVNFKNICYNESGMTAVEAIMRAAE